MKGGDMLSFHKAITSERGMKAWLKQFMIDEKFARIQSLNYTGDGATSNAITTLIQPQIIIITCSGNAADLPVFIWMDKMGADEAQSLLSAGAAAASIDKAANMIIAVGTLSFTVDDAGGDAHPNKNNQVYDVIIIGY